MNQTWVVTEQKEDRERKRSESDSAIRQDDEPSPIVTIGPNTGKRSDQQLAEMKEASVMIIIDVPEFAAEL